MRKQRLDAIIEEQTHIYINNIARELEEKHDKWFEGFGFPIFGTTSKDYHEQVYFESYLEHYTRIMINAILKEIAEEEVSDYITWPEFEFPGDFRGFSNSEYEQEFGFEFINADRKIGYRYTDFFPSQIEALLAKGNVDTIKLIRVC